MLRALSFLVVLSLAGASGPVQDPPSQVLLNAALYTTADDLWADVREVDPAFRAIGADVAKLAKGLEADSLEDRGKAAAALKALGVSAFEAIKEERDRTTSDQARWELGSILKDLAGDWPGAKLDGTLGKPMTKGEGEALRAEVAKLAKGLHADAIDDRGTAAGALKALGPAAYGAIREERNKTKSEQARRELDGILKELAGPSIGVPAGRHLGKTEAADFRKRLSERKITIYQQPFISMKDGQPATIFVGEETSASSGRRRVRLDADGKKLQLEEKQPARMLKIGFQMQVLAKISGKDPKSVSLEIAITNSHIRKPIREVETPLGRVLDPEVIEIGVDLSPVLESGQHYVAGPFPSAEEKGAPWWLLIEAQIIK